MKKHKIYLGHLTRSITAIETEIEKDAMDKNKIQTLLEQLEVKYKKLEEASNKIQEAVDIQELEKEIDSLSENQDKVIEIKRKVQDILEKEVLNNTLESHSSNNESRNTVNGGQEKRIKLPKLNIKVFDGNVENYQEFMDSYTASIHNNDQLENIEKFIYLRTYLTGEASQAIEGFSTTNDNYKVAMQLLQETFGRK